MWPIRGKIIKLSLLTSANLRNSATYDRRISTGMAESPWINCIIPFWYSFRSSFNPEILIINATLADIPLKTGFSPTCWWKGLNVMLEKVAGNFNVEKLRIILLFEADFNYNNKWLGCMIMWNAESAGMMADEQYGSHKQKSAIIQCLNKMFFYDLVWFWRQPAALCSNDAKSCYDCIVLLVAALCLCCLGANKMSVFSMISTLQQMDHHIQTTYGDSGKSGNCKKWGSPIAGIGQGNGAGPQIWAAVSSPLLELMKEDRFFAMLVGAFSLVSQSLVGFAFVDDTDLCVTHP